MRLAALALALLLAACGERQAPPPAPIIHARAGPAKVVPPSSGKRVARPRPRPAQTPAVPASPVSASVDAGKRDSAPSAPPIAAVPPGARIYAPLLATKQRALWPQAPEPWTLGGLVEQESCVSLKSPRCWNPHAELKTKREYGFGFGQVTVAYNGDGAERFNKFDELKKEYASLSAWRWADRYDPGYQLAAVVEMTHGLWRRVPPAADSAAQWAFTLSSYNGGLGGLLQDRRLCANTAGCDVKRWFGHVEAHSLKSRAPQPSYAGQSWFSINRGYVRNVMTLRRAKYRPFWGGA